MFELEALQAQHGDCLLLHYGTAAKPQVIVIDGGPPPVYDKALRPALQKLKDDRGGTLKLPMVMVSHLDDDHIGGITKLSAELCDQLDNQQEQSWKIDTIWTNTFADLVKDQPVLGSSLDAAAVSASVGESLPGGDLEWSGAVVANVGQGRQLRDQAKRLGKVNAPFDGLVISRQKAIDMKDGLSFVVVGPNESELAKLQKEWNKQIKRLKNKKKAPADVAAYIDESAYNLSSVVVIAKSGGKTMLLTGDARGDYILQSLEDVGAVKKGKTLQVDILKMPHHGSDRNVDTDFFERIVADHYVFSGNGKFDNPEPECVRMLIDARGNDAYTMHLTYDPDNFVPGYPKAKLTKLKKLLKPGPGQKFKVETASAGKSIRIALS